MNSVINLCCARSSAAFNHIKRVIAIGAIVMAFGVFAEPVEKGMIIVRGGAANTAANYDKEDRDPNGRLENVSALCGTKDLKDAAALVATDHSRNWGAYMTSNTTTIINLGGSVTKDPQPRNPNHCLINGLTLGQIKGIWN